MQKYLHSFYHALIRTIYSDGIEHAGYMSFMVILSFFPFLVFFLSLTYALGAYNIGQDFLDVMIETTPEYAIEAISVWLDELKRAPPRGIMNLAIIGAIWTASSFVECLRTILNKIFDVRSPPSYIARRLLSILQFVILCLCIWVVMIIFILLPNIAKYLNLNELGYKAYIWGYYKNLYFSSSLFLCVLGFYTFIPNARLKTFSMIPGAILTTSLWQLCGSFLSYYILYYQQLNFVYGSLGNIIITLMFIYVVNFLFIVGAAFNYHLSISNAKRA